MFLSSFASFLSDQLLGATSDELSAALQWDLWTNIVGFCLSTISGYLIIIPNQDDFSCEVFVSNVTIHVAGIYAVPLALTQCLHLPG